jgi:hypothetical protein
MAYVLFISENKIKDSTAIGGNVDMEFMLPYIKVAQKKYIETKLGTDLFEALQTKITASSLTGAYQTLVDDYIQDALVHFAFYECLPFLRFKVSNGNIYSKSSETGTALSQDEAQHLREEVRNTAEFYVQRLIDYITNNTSSFPEYSTSSGADISPDKDAYYSGMNLEINQEDKRGITLDDFLTPDLH